MRVLYIEPFHGGSHAAFGEALMSGLPGVAWTPLTMPARHWKWRMRGAAAHLAVAHGEALRGDHDLLFASSYLALAELVGLVPALGQIPRVLYFHENQLAFPVRDAYSGERDTHFGFTQLTSGLAATRCVFNSAHNRDSMFAEADALLRRMPDAVPPGWVDALRARSEVIGLPLDLPSVEPAQLVDLPADDPERALGPLIVWSHRWEHDKNPERFFAALERLARDGVPFRVAVCGQRFRKVPEVFERARARLGDRVVAWGPAPREAYVALLRRVQIAVSTAHHEFFGVSMLEATHCGARPLVPDRLAYPELFPADYRYADEALEATLANLCVAWSEGAPLRDDRRALTEPHAAVRVCPRYAALFGRLSDAGADPARAGRRQTDPRRPR